jgi:FkbM family methyltransferase
MVEKANMLQFIYDRSTAKNKYRWHFFNFLRIWIARFFDPAVRFTLCGRSILLPFSHSLPILLKNHPLYSANLTRLAAFLRIQDDRLRMIDVGANVGDSYCSVDPRPGDSFLLIEGEKRSYTMLTANTANDPSVEREFAFLMERDLSSEKDLVVQSKKALIRPGASKSADSPVSRTTLKRILQMHPAFWKSNLLKVDVEGYDGRVLMGGRRFLARSQPVLFFEYHPRKIAALGDDPLSIFPALEKLGYAHLMVYDNLGYFLGVHRSDALEAIGDLTSYAMTRGIYFDLSCFPRSRDALGRKFLSEERNYYAKAVETQAP